MVFDPELADLVAAAADAFSPSQSSLAAEIGVRPLALTTWRRGRSRPTAEHLRALARALEARGERLRELAAQLERQAASQGKLTRRPRRVSARTNCSADNGPWPQRASSCAVGREAATTASAVTR